ncbi:hypothetical protein [Streptomyces shenzhenensis]|uniref:hypothetical protein n=1 Tax=Streptomyces shenzhenensis TaxID=943815 RepID=UPI0015F11C92|nr:hypothetical protein [Streptomyces shenzhenensis]
MAALADGLNASLDEQVAAGRGLLGLPDAGEGGAETFVQAWIGRIRDPTDHARAGKAGTASVRLVEGVDRPSGKQVTGQAGVPVESGRWWPGARVSV